jgi:hypothetical protein
LAGCIGMGRRRCQLFPAARLAYGDADLDGDRHSDRASFLMSGAPEVASARIRPVEPRTSGLLRPFDLDQFRAYMTGATHGRTHAWQR